MFKIYCKRGSALMQVLVLGAIIASVVILLLRFSATRTVNVMKTSRKVAAKAYAEGCMAQFMATAMFRELHGLPPKSGNQTFLLPSGSTEVSVPCTIQLKDGTNFSTNMVFRQADADVYTDVAGNSVAIPPKLLKMTLEIPNTDKLN